MRNRLTNILQLSILVTGLCYIGVGVMFVISPVLVCKLFMFTITPEWPLQLIDDFQVFLYLATLSFSLVITVVGFSMFLPLFDPLKYRGLIIFNGAILPFVLGSFMYKFALINGYKIAYIPALCYTFLFFCNSIALAATYSQASRGIE